MEGLKKVMFPVDLSGVSSKIIPDVIATAKKFDAELHLVHVAGSLEHFSLFYVPHTSLNQFEGEIMKGAERKLQEFVEEYFQDFPKLKTKVLRGEPAEEILKYVDSERIDLVIVGTHGRKGLDRVIFGSVAEQVVKHSPVPVMSINPYKKD